MSDELVEISISNIQPRTGFCEGLSIYGEVKIKGKCFTYRSNIDAPCGAENMIEAIDEVKRELCKIIHYEEMFTESGWQAPAEVKDDQ